LSPLGGHVPAAAAFAAATALSSPAPADPRAPDIDLVMGDDVNDDRPNIERHVGPSCDVRRHAIALTVMRMMPTPETKNQKRKNE
jgi:hypothetical protein